MIPWYHFVEFTGLSNLQIIRKRKNLSQQQLSIKSGVPLASIRAYERRERNINRANVHTVRSLAKALGCSPDDLYEDTDVTRPRTKTPK